MLIFAIKYLLFLKYGIRTPQLMFPRCHLALNFCLNSENIAVHLCFQDTKLCIYWPNSVSNQLVLFVLDPHLVHGSKDTIYVSMYDFHRCLSYFKLEHFQ